MHCRHGLYSNINYSNIILCSGLILVKFKLKFFGSTQCWITIICNNKWDILFSKNNLIFDYGNKRWWRGWEAQFILIVDVNEQNKRTKSNSNRRASKHFGVSSLNNPWYLTCGSYTLIYLQQSRFSVHNFLHNSWTRCNIAPLHMNKNTH